MVRLKCWEETNLASPPRFCELVLFFTNFFTVTLACESFLHALLLAWFQVEGVALNFLDDVFGLHFALKTAQRILKGLAFLDTNFCQGKYTSKLA